GFTGTAGLSVTPSRPAHPSRATGCSNSSTPWGFPCCARLPGVRAVANTPAQRLRASAARFPSRLTLPRPARPLGPRTVLLEAGSAFTRVTACTLATSPNRDALHRRLRLLRYLHSRSGCFRLEHSPGGTLTPLEDAAFSRRTRFRET